MSILLCRCNETSLPSQNQGILGDRRIQKFTFFSSSRSELKFPNVCDEICFEVTDKVSSSFRWKLGEVLHIGRLKRVC